jgi:hypothetical protein
VAGGVEVVVVAGAHGDSVHAETPPAYRPVAAIHNSSVALLGAQAAVGAPSGANLLPLPSAKKGFAPEGAPTGSITS